MGFARTELESEMVRWVSLWARPSDGEDLCCERIRNESKDEERPKSTKSCVICDDKHEACIS